MSAPEPIIGQPAYERIQSKKDALSFELNNFDKIVMFPTGAGFWNATGHSAFFMYHLIHDILDLRNQIKSDYDYYLKQTRFFTAYNAAQIIRIRSEIQKLGFDILRSDDRAFVFALKDKISPQQCCP
jgi:hypothetical protein